MLKFVQLNHMNAYYCYINGWIIFKSYNTIVALYDRTNNIMFKSDVFYSVTTSKQFTIFCREVLGINNNDKEWKKRCLQLVTEDEIQNLLNNEIL